MDVPDRPDSEDAWQKVAEHQDLLERFVEDDEPAFEEEAERLLAELEERGLREESPGPPDSDETSPLRSRFW